MKRNIWHPFDGYPEIMIGQYLVPNFVSNSVCLEVNENEYVLYSPGFSLLESWPHKDNANITIHIILPNAYHYLGLSTWLKAFPNAIIYASQVALEQLQTKKVESIDHKILCFNTEMPPLPQNYEISFPPGHRAGDVWLVKRKINNGSLWITCDSFLNYERVSNQPIARLMQKLLGAAPGLKMSQVVKWFILDDRKKFKIWALNKIKHDKPVALIPSHGEATQSDNLSLELENLLKQRL